MENTKALTLTVLSKMTANYGEGLGNVSSVQKVFRNGNTYTARSRESLKNAIMVQSGMYDDLITSVDGATQKFVGPETNVSNCKALEGGYMNTNSGKDKMVYKRNSSFYLTDAISCDVFINETRFHNNLHLATTHAKQNDLNVQKDAKATGLMPYNYEYDKNIRCYSITFDLEMIGKDENFDAEADDQEKSNRVIAVLDAIEHLHLVVKGNLDNAEPIFIVGGLSDRKTHTFENVINSKHGKLSITKDLIDKIDKGYNVALLEGDNFENEKEIIEKLKPNSITSFFDNLKNEVKEYFGV